MAILVEDNDQVKNPLSLSLTIIDLETYDEDTTEGWLNYAIQLLKGGETIIKNEGTIHDIDIRSLEDACMSVSHKIKEVEPLEPDFTLTTERLPEDDAVLTCFVDIANAENDGYSFSALGIRIPTTVHDLNKFGEALKAERITITKDEKYSL